MKKKLKNIIELAIFLGGIACAAIAFPSESTNKGIDTNVSERVSEVTSDVPLVCMHGYGLTEEHICEHVQILTNDETYTINLNYPEPEKVDIEPGRIILIKEFLENVEQCEDEILVYNLSSKGIDNWFEFEYEIMCYCAGYYAVDDNITGNIAEIASTDENGKYSVEVDIKHAKEVIELCQQEPERQEFIENSVKLAVSRMRLTGNKVQDLKLIHDFICNYASYDDNLRSHTVYEFFANQKTLCDGYSLVFKLMCDYIGIETHYIVGYVGKEDITHAWNSVEIDSKTYFVDLTWDDTDEKDNPIKYEDFLTPTHEGTALYVDGELVH